VYKEVELHNQGDITAGLEDLFFLNCALDLYIIFLQPLHYNYILLMTAYWITFMTIIENKDVKNNMLNTTSNTLFVSPCNKDKIGCWINMRNNQMITE